MKTHRTKAFAGFAMGLLIIGFVLWSRPHGAEKVIGPSNHLLEAAELKNGKAILSSCKACHSAAKGEAHKLGPNLYNLVGTKIASQQKYEYTESLKKIGSQYWTIDNLDAWLKDPQSFAPGNKMSFEGLSDPQDRMDLIAYLQTLSE